MRSRAERPNRRLTPVLLDLWALVLATVLCAPMLVAGGYGLARDLVFVPHHALGADDIGLGSSLPRAVPLDAVLGLLGSVIDGAVVFRVAVLGVLVLAGCGAHRLLPTQPTAVRLFLAGAAVWNPYVVERLSLGQWALLASYAASWWLIPVVRSCVSGRDRSAWGRLALWMALASLTPSGGLVALLVATGTALAATRRVRPVLSAVLVGAAFQLPWVLPSVLGTASGLSDPRGAAAFAARPERAGGTLWSLLATGGIWDRHVVPGSLTGLGGHALSILCVLVLVVSVRAVGRLQPGLPVVAAIGLALAVAGAVPGLDGAMGWVVSHVPGGGLVRDGQKWLAPYVVLVVACGADSLGRLGRWLRSQDRDAAWLAVVAALVLPVALLADGPRQTWQVLAPVLYPADLTEAVGRLADAPSESGDVVTLPWQSYRLYRWGRPVSASDPALRWSARPALVSDSLRVDAGSLNGEDPRARRVGRIVTGAGPWGRPLAQQGVGWVLVYRDQPGASGLDLEGLRPVVEGRRVALYAVAGPVRTPPRASAAARTLVAVVDVGLLAAALVGAGVGLAGRRRRRQRHSSSSSPRQ
ncbi:MAG: hypothetical protein ABI873_04445 [Marmoricola sp.]